MLLLLMIFAVNTVQQMNEADDPTYSQVRTLFEQEKVKYFVLNGKDLGLQIREEGDKVSTVHYQLPDLSVFYSDLHELIDQQHESGVLEGYDYKVGIEGTWWYRMLPYLVLLLVMAAFWYMMYLRQSGGSSGGGPGPSRFGHARTRTLADQGRRSPSRMWPVQRRRRRSCGRSWSSSGSPRSIWTWGRISPRACCW